METRSKTALRLQVLNGNTESPAKKRRRPCICCSSSSESDECEKVPKKSPKNRKQKQSPRKKVNTPKKRKTTGRTTRKKRVPRANTTVSHNTSVSTPTNIIEPPTSEIQERRPFWVATPPPCLSPQAGTSYENVLRDERDPPILFPSYPPQYSSDDDPPDLSPPHTPSSNARWFQPIPWHLETIPDKGELKIEVGDTTIDEQVFLGGVPAHRDYLDNPSNNICSPRGQNDVLDIHDNIDPELPSFFPEDDRCPILIRITQSSPQDRSSSSEELDEVFKAPVITEFTDSRPGNQHCEEPLDLTNGRYESLISHQNNILDQETQNQLGEVQRNVIGLSVVADQQETRGNHTCGTIQVEPLDQHSQRQHDSPPYRATCRSHSVPVSGGGLRDLFIADSDDDYRNCPDCEMISRRNAQHWCPPSSPPPPPPIPVELPAPVGTAESLAPPPPAALVKLEPGTHGNFTQGSGADGYPESYIRAYYWPVFRHIRKIGFMMNQRPELSHGLAPLREVLNVVGEEHNNLWLPNPDSNRQGIQSPDITVLTASFSFSRQPGNSSNARE